MLRLLTIIILVSNIYAFSYKDILLKDYNQNKNIKVERIKLQRILKLKKYDFDAYFLDVSLKFKPLNKTISQNEVVFIKGDLVLRDIFDINKAISLRDEFLGKSVQMSFIKKEGVGGYDKDCN